VARAPRELLRYECSIVVAAPPADVFAVVGDLARTPEWAGSGHVRSIVKVTDGPVGVGTRYRSSEKITMSYRAETEITVYRPDAAIEWKSKPAGERVPYHHWAFHLEPDGNGTRLTHTVRAMRAAGLMGWVQRLGFLFTRPRSTIPAGMDRTLARVKEIAEGTR
jgi:uncharacterized protein YndB with AHSA1/START domain